jgi:hypothetical protein
MPVLHDIGVAYVLREGLHILRRYLVTSPRQALGACISYWWIIRPQLFEANR